MKKIAYLLSAIAMMATGAASLGCLWVVMDEPRAMRNLCDYKRKRPIIIYGRFFVLQ